MEQIQTSGNSSEESDRFLTHLTDTPEHNVMADTPNGEMKSGQNKKRNLWKRLLDDEYFRRRFIHSLCLCLAFVGMGWIDGQMGPSFPDIRNIVGQSVETGAWLFTAYSFGYAVGSLIEGVLYGRVNDFLSLHVWFLIAAVTTGIIPWCTSFIVMLVVKFIGSFGCGAVEAIAYASIAAMWEEEGRFFMQCLHLGYAVGGIISPIATEPYLSKKSCMPILSENNTYHGNDSTRGTTIKTTNISKTTDCQWEYGETNVQIAYLITAILMLAIAVPFIVMYIQSRRATNTLQMNLDKTDTKRPEQLPICLKTSLLVLLCSILFINGCIMDGFTGFLMTFCLEYLGWTKEQGSFASSAFWLAGAASQFGSIFIVKIILPETLVLIFTLLQAVASIGFLVVSLMMSVEGVWFFNSFLGLFMSVVCASVYSWTEESILELTGWVSTFFCIAYAAGSLLNPLLIGYLIEQYDPVIFPYVFVVQSCLGIIVVLICKVLVHVYVRPIKQHLR